jgi:hypothetical protein
VTTLQKRFSTHYRCSVSWSLLRHAHYLCNKKEQGSAGLHNQKIEKGEEKKENRKLNLHRSVCRGQQKIKKGAFRSERKGN